MRTLLVIIMESAAAASAVAQTLDVTLGDRVETIYMTYATRGGLSQEVYQRTDLFILDVFEHDALGPRAGGISTAEKFAAGGRRTLLLAARVMTDRVDCPWYWDMAASDSLPERVLSVLTKLGPQAEDFAKLRQAFAPYCRKAHDGHHH